MGKQTNEGEYGSRFRRSRHRLQEAERVVEGLNALPIVDLLTVDSGEESQAAPVAVSEVGVPLNAEEQLGLAQYLQLGGAALPHAAELRIA